MIEVLLFAQARDALGSDRTAVAVDAATTVGALKARLGEEHPALAALVARSRLAVNRAFASDDDPVAPGDEVALIPPVSGG